MASAKQMRTLGDRGARKCIGESFTLSGGDVSPAADDAAIRHATYLAIDDGVTKGYRVTMALGQPDYDPTLPSTAILVAIKLDNVTGHVASATRLVDLSDGLPGPREFDVVVRTIAGAVVQTSGLQVAWMAMMKDIG